MNLGDVCKGISIVGKHPTHLDLSKVEIHSIQEDSRKVNRGDLFVAVSGYKSDGHQFLSMAAKLGAFVAIVEHIDTQLSLPQIQVSSSTIALALLAANFYGHPTKDLLLCGITGTSGKTTTSFLTEALLSQAGYNPGMIGTIVYRFQGQEKPAPLTTPGALLLQGMLADMRNQGAKSVVMEASSHALSQNRLLGVEFDVAAFTNLSRDHLDFHATMEEYFQAKARLFHEHIKQSPNKRRCVVCIDDEYGLRLAKELPSPSLIAVATTSAAKEKQKELKAPILITSEERFSLKGISATLSSPKGPIYLQSSLCGSHNLANLAVAAGIGVALDLSPEVISRGLSSLKGIPGRLGKVGHARTGPTVFVDYAHKPEALLRVLQTLRSLMEFSPPPVMESSAPLMGSSPPPLQTSPPRLFVVFGCGGDRDRGKRPLMGKIATEEADIVILTSDNPRTENPEQILQEIEQGAAGSRLTSNQLSSAQRGYLSILDRKEAIAAAILAAREDDVVLLAGKGHEDYQIIGEEKFPFDDREEARAALQNRFASQNRSR